ncbi:molecular chaperone DnaJ [Candidatus Uhrbacteria bacterium]|nr:molecular chaperone DnaJ [Candidatus Uhrbacteria bacterium]
MAKDFYKILGVDKNASDDDIKKAYRRLAHQYHPDKGGGDEAKFKEVNEAYQVLGDKKKRQTYDQFGSAAFENGGMGAGGPFGGGFGGFDFRQGFPGGFSGGDMGDLGDILGEMFGFGGRGGSRDSARGRNIEMDMELTFHEAAFGVEKMISLYKQVACLRCKGDGAEPGSKTITCQTCQGSGQVKQTQRTMFGSVQVATPCTACHGRGKKPEKECTNCRGAGVEKREEKISIAIPAGIDNEEVVKAPGQGEAAPYGGRTGDLFLRVHVKSDARFERDGHDIHSDLVIPFSTMALGGTVTAETLDGHESIKVHEGTIAGTIVTLRGKGVPYLRSSGRGNHHIRVIPDIPKKLTKEQKRLLDELKKEGL